MNYGFIYDEILRRKAKRIIICPYGNMGVNVYRDLKDRYGLSDKIYRVDKAISKINPEIYSWDYLKNIEWDGDDICLVASDNPLIYYDLREEIMGIVPKKNILDCAAFNPLCFDGNPRIAALAILAEEIYRNGISGSVVEAGVWRGDFARFINMLFPRRRIYLFDSFEGFSEKSFDLENDTYEQVRNWGGYKADTSVNTVLGKLPYPDRAVIKKGYIPETLIDIDDTFAFVNLDMDLYMPTIEALRFFWDKMSPGGYIFVHDVNNWDGCGKAVRDFCDEYGTGYICLNDRITAAIPKPYQRRENKDAC